jgi:exodeoxyribonuclease VII large subunit
MTQGSFSFSDSDHKTDRLSYQTDFFDKKKPARKDSAAKSHQLTAAPKAGTVYSVTQITRMIKLTLNEHLPGRIVLTGEISNCKPHSSGHLYLTLKDENAQVTAVMWKSAFGKLKFRPTDGMAVLATGCIDVYEPQGKYQFYIDKLEPSGAGALDLAFRRLTEQLRKEGLFDESHKKPLPKFPATIAIVTSPTGAAVKDIDRTLSRRFPVVRKLLYPVAVQGENAAGEIASAVSELNRRRAELGGIDLIIVGRGGGSLEDLWAFNEEVVARAVFASEIPVISAVGHEIDITIADMVADQRAATPTAAAELAVPDHNELRPNLRQYQYRMEHSLRSRCGSARDGLRQLTGRTMFVRPLDLLWNKRQLLDERTATLSRHFSDMLRRTDVAIDNFDNILRRIEPHTALARADTRLMELQHRLRSAMSEFCRACENQLTVIFSRFGAATPSHRVICQRNLLDNTARRINTARSQFLRQNHQQLDTLIRRLENLNPRAVLNRGYSITRLKENKRIVDDKSKIKAGDRLLTELANKTIIESEVTSPRN